MTDATTRLVDAYYDSWGRGDFERFGEILTDAFVFRGAATASPGSTSTSTRRGSRPLADEVRGRPKP